MRILIVGDTNHHAVNTVSRLLKEDGHEVGIHTHPVPARTSIDRLRGSFGLNRNPAQLRAIIGRWQPDCVHVVGMSTYPAPALSLAARQAGVRTIWTATDYAPLCPVGGCRTPEGSVCEECMHGSRRIMARKCIDRKAWPSFMGLLDNLYWDAQRLAKVADTVAVTSEFMRNKWLEAGFPSQRVVTLPLPADDCEAVADVRDDYFCFVGHLTPESGIETLVRAAIAAEVPVVIAGDGALRQRIVELTDRTPLIRLIDSATPDLIARAKAVIVPSESYLDGEERVKHGLCHGTPVIASAIASLPEMVSDTDGITFTPGNTEELASVLREFDKRHAFDYHSIARRARSTYSSTTFYKNLIKLYRGC